MDSSEAPLPVSPHILRVPCRSLVVFAGIPGAGKSTALDDLRQRHRPDQRSYPGLERTGPIRPVPSIPLVVVDSDQVRARLRRATPRGFAYRWYRPLVHLLHRIRIAWCCVRSSGPVVAHEPATRASTRVWLALCGWLTGRRCVLVWLHVDAGVALSGQRSRGRQIRPWAFARHVRRAERLYELLHAGVSPGGWHWVHVLTRNDLAVGLVVQVACKGSRGDLRPVLEGGA